MEPRDSRGRQKPWEPSVHDAPDTQPWNQHYKPRLLISGLQAERLQCLQIVGRRFAATGSYLMDNCQPIPAPAACFIDIGRAMCTIGVQSEEKAHGSRHARRT